MTNTRSQPRRRPVGSSVMRAEHTKRMFACARHRRSQAGTLVDRQRARPYSPSMAATRALRTLGPAVVIAGLLCVGAAPGTARAAQRAPESWSAPTAVPGAVTNGDPAVVAFDGDLYAAWVGKSSPYKIYYSRFNGSTWSASATIPSALTTEYTKPSLAVYEGDLYAEWVGQSSPYHLWFAGFNGSAWTGQTEVPFALTAAFSSPSIAAYGGYLWFSWIGASNKAVWFESVEGGSWSGQAKIPPASG